MLTSKPKSDGFTLIELMITILIFSITLTFGVSSYRTWVMNTQIRNAAESFQNGLLRTRAEAVKRNASTVFTIGTGSSWQISVAGSGVIETRNSSEGSKNVSVAVTPTGTDTITFNSLGMIAPNVDTTATPNQLDFDSSVAAPGVARALRVTIGLGGIVRVCDPSLSGTNPQAC